jgi:hypothetical protein
MDLLGWMIFGLTSAMVWWWVKLTDGSGRPLRLRSESHVYHHPC